jgi:hypothetical protein
LKKLNKNIFPADFGQLLLLVFASIIFNYFAPVLLKDFWYFFVLWLYFRSKDEPFWLVFFLILNDGFASFFGYKGANIDSITFLPQFEVGHLYVIIAFSKILKRKLYFPVFYSKLIFIMSLYIVFLFVYGLMQGIPNDYNIYFRSIRVVFPFLLLYIIPKLFITSYEYERLFSCIFLVSILAFFSQLFSIIAGESPISFMGIQEGHVTAVSETTIYRGFYNTSATLIAFFGSMYYLAGKANAFPRSYLQIVLISSIGTAFLSATRGWIVGLGLSFVFYFIIVNKGSLKRIIKFAIPLIFLVLLGLLQPKINQQLRNALTRLKTMEAVLEGDLSAGGTASRATVQGPAVLKVWRESPFIGYGFSDTFYKNQNIHVGNENVLLHSGIIGVLFLIIFIVFFHLRLILLSGKLNGSEPFGRSLLVFPVFFLALFIIHSTSGQFLGYLTTYRSFFALAVFFSFGSYVHNQVVVYLKSHHSS